MAGTSTFVKTTTEEATAAADMIFDVKPKGTYPIRVFIRAIEDGDEWTYEALETTMSGRLATCGGWPDRGYDDRDEALGKIESLVARHLGSAVRVK